MFFFQLFRDLEVSFFISRAMELNLESKYLVGDLSISLLCFGTLQTEYMHSTLVSHDRR